MEVLFSLPKEWGLSPKVVSLKAGLLTFPFLGVSVVGGPWVIPLIKEGPFGFLIIFALPSLILIY